ncbi:hypothetical protein ACCS91_33515 [Rhizobium ruizarguesonis]
MANRILLDASGLKISSPGFDVLTTGNANLLFSSDWSALSILMVGSVTVPANGSQTVFFGRTFTRSPIVRIPWNGYGMDPNGGYYYLTLNEAWQSTSIATLRSDRLIFTNTSSIPFVAYYYIWNYG